MLTFCGVCGKINKQKIFLEEILMKKVLALVLALLLILPVVVACGGPAEPEDTTPADTTPSDPTTPDDPGTVTPVVDYEFDGEIKNYDTTIRVLARSGEQATNWGNYDLVYDEENELVVTEIKNAIKKRNDKLEEDMGVTINHIPSSDPYNDAYIGLYMGRDQYDLILPGVKGAGTMAQSGFLLAMDELPNMNPEKGFYDQRAFKQLAINGRNYLFFSEITVVNLDATWLYYFNHELIDEYVLENPYQLLQDYQWTIGKLIDMCAIATKDADGTATKEDDWGIVGHDYIITSLYHGTGEMIATADETGEISITMNTPRVIQFVNKVIELRQYWARYQLKLSGIANDTNPYGFASGDNYNELMKTFAGGRALFMGEVLASARDLTAIDDGTLNIGILPCPLLDENQEEYFTPVNDIAACTVVPFTAEPRAEDLSNIIEYWAYLSHDTLYEAYYEQAQKSRFSKDDISPEVIDMIFDAVSYDIGAGFAWGNLARELTAIVWDGSTDFASMYDRCGGAAQSALNEFMDKFVG